MAWTFQSLIDSKMTVMAYCHNSACNHHQELDLPALRDRFGPDAPAMHDDLAPRLRCAKCGGRDVGLTYSPAENAQRYPRNAYAKVRG